jgi:hypothetical protein
LVSEINDLLLLNFFNNFFCIVYIKLVLEKE